MSPRIFSARLLPFTLSLLVGCALGDHYDSDTRGPAKPANSSGAPAESDSDMGSEGDSVATWVTSESHSGGGDPNSDSGDVTAGPTTDDPPTTTASGANTTADNQCGEPCDTPPNDCYDTIGECTDSVCRYYPLGSETACDDGDPCTQADACDGFGGCAGTALECDTPPHARDSCLEGACTGVFTCEEPWENCDGDWDNGCEIPTGVPHQCNIDGINPDEGCWTAHCGSINDPLAFNFGYFFCYHCSTCRQVGESAQRCDDWDGTWLPLESEECGAELDQVCAP